MSLSLRSLTMQLAPIPGNKMIRFLGCIELACIMFSSIKFFISPFLDPFVGNLYVCPPLMGTRIPSYHFQWYMEDRSMTRNSAYRNPNHIYTSMAIVLGRALTECQLYLYTLLQWGWCLFSTITGIYACSSPRQCLEVHTPPIASEGPRSDNIFTSIGMAFGRALTSCLLCHGCILLQWRWYYKHTFISAHSCGL